MKIYRNGFIYLCVVGLGLVSSLAPRLRAQQADAAIPSTDPAIAPQNPTTQNPTTQNPAAAAPAAQNPTTQNPTQQIPPATPAPPVTQQPTGGPIVNAAPALPKYPDVRLPGEYGFYLGIEAWLPQQQPILTRVAIRATRTVRIS